MNISRALKSLVLCILTTSSLYSGVTLALAEVENRSGPSQFGHDQVVDENAAGNSSLELLKKIEFLQQEMSELRGKLEEQTYQMQQLQEHQKKLYLDLDKRLRDGSPAKVSGVSSVSLGEREEIAAKSMQGNLDARVSSQFAQEETTPTQASSNLTALTNTEDAVAEERMYQQAYHLIQSKDYQGALTAFQAMVKTYPQGKYLPNAQYWLGEIYLVKGNLDLAAQSFDVVYRRYPDHPKAADSLLKLGYVEYAKGRWKQSHDFLTQVKSQFPGTTSAQLADSRLQKMQQEGHY
jgi:tol-pal system protein YbgF